MSESVASQRNASAPSTSPLSSSTRGCDGLARERRLRRLRGPAASEPARHSTLQRAHRGLGLLLPLRDDADEIADDHRRYDARKAPKRRLVHADQRAPDMIAGIEPRIRRPDHAAVQHSRQPHVVDDRRARLSPWRADRRVAARSRRCDRRTKPALPAHRRRARAGCARRRSVRRSVTRRLSSAGVRTTPSSTMSAFAATPKRLGACRRANAAPAPPLSAAALR